MKKLFKPLIILSLPLLVVFGAVLHTIGKGNSCNHQFKSYVAGTKQVQIYTHSEQVKNVVPAQYYPCIVFRDELIWRTECKFCGESHDEIKENPNAPEKHQRAYGY